MAVLLEIKEIKAMRNPLNNTLGNVCLVQNGFRDVSSSPFVRFSSESLKENTEGYLKVCCERFQRVVINSEQSQLNS